MDKSIRQAAILEIVSPTPKEELTKWISGYLWFWEDSGVLGGDAAELIARVAEGIFAADPRDVERLLPKPSFLFRPLDNPPESTRQIELYESLIRNQTSGTATDH
jgi:hypothetical protein